MNVSQTPVIWAVVIATLIVLLAGFFMVNSVSNKLELANNDVTNKLGNLNSKVDKAASDIQKATSSIPTTTKVDPSLCNNVDGCGGWWDVTGTDKTDVVDRVVDELTEDDNRDLYKYIKNLVDIDDNDDITSVSLHKTGEVRTNEDPDFGDSDSRMTTTDFVLKVVYFEDGSSTEEKTKYFRIQSVVDDLEDGLSSSDVSITSAVKVDKDYSLPSQ